MEKPSLKLFIIKIEDQLETVSWIDRSLIKALVTAYSSLQEENRLKKRVPPTLFLRPQIRGASVDDRAITVEKLE